METLSNWDQQRMDRLETLYRDGMSFSLIAADIGVTRNAAIGKARRMHLPKRYEIVQCLPGRTANPNSLPRRRRDRAIAMKKAKPKIVVVPGKDYRCDILGLNNTTCRFPTWSISAPARDRLYCGVPTASFSEGVPYCQHHCRLCLTSQH